MTSRPLRHSILLPLFVLAGLVPAATTRAAADLEPQVAEWQAAFNAHDARRLGALYAPDAEIAGIKPDGWQTERGPAAAVKAVEPYFTAFPDVRLAATRIFHAGDRVFVEWVSAGTNTGSLGGAPPTGKRAGISGITLLRYDRKGLIRRSETVFDEVTLAQQVGLVPGPARPIPSWPVGPAAWIEAGKPAVEADAVAAAKATWPATWNKHDHRAYDAVITDDAAHIELAGADSKGRAACLAELDRYLEALPDAHATVDEGWGFGDVAILKFTFRGTMKGPIGPFKPTGKPIVIHGIDVDDLRDRKMARAVTYSNGVELLTELGVLPKK
jgi:steroid delta-isomerase-like uncharacterized protein